MKFSNWFHIFLIFLLYSCNTEKSTEAVENDLEISLSADSSEVLLSNIPTYVLDELRADSLDNNLWTNFFAIYKDTSDVEMRDFQTALEGVYTISNGSVRFKPKLTWDSNGEYFARCYTKTLLRKPEDIISRRSINTRDGFIEFKFDTKQ